MDEDLGVIAVALVLVICVASVLVWGVYRGELAREAKYGKCSPVLQAYSNGQPLYGLVKNFPECKAELLDAIKNGEL